MSMDRVAAHAMYRMSRGSDATKNSLTPGTLRRTLRFIMRYRYQVILYMGVSVIGAVLGVISPVLAGDVVNAIVDTADTDLVIRLAVLIAIVAVADAALAVMSRWQASALGERVIYDLRTLVFRHVQRMPVAFFMRTRTGALVSRLNNDVIGAQTAISRTLSGVVMNVVSLILTLAVMLTTSWQITLISLVLLPLFLIPARLMGRRLATLTRLRANQNAAMNDQMTERFSAPGATLVKLYGHPQREIEQFTARADRVRGTGVSISVRQTIFTTMLTLVSALALAAVYGFGGVEAITGSLNAGDVVTMALLLTRLYGPLTGLASARVEMMSALVSFDRIFEVLDLKPMITDPPKPVSIPAGPVRLDVEQLSFAYPSASEVSLASLEEVAVLDTRGGEQVLHNIEFSVEPGQTYALVGSSGAGKSTIASLLARLYDPTEGAIRYNGVDARDVTAQELHATVAMVTQDPHLFHTTIRDNLTMAKPEADDAEVLEALNQAYLHDLLERLPDGLDTVVGERGYRLSGGERQRLALARMLLASPQVVILDEATASLDSTSEYAIQQALNTALSDRTAVVIAHRLSTIHAADQILVVEDGRIIERGTHDELMNTSGRYAQLYQTQFKNADEPSH